MAEDDKESGTGGEHQPTYKRRHNMDKNTNEARRRLILGAAARPSPRPTRR
ncbi:MAG: hypothetical protein MO853_07675 [Candidatus Protistobacter heckmanni]|nr:hypothetical protein [Candidatus Protistobacter heckmanni]